MIALASGLYTPAMRGLRTPTNDIAVMKPLCIKRGFRKALSACTSLRGLLLGG